MKLMVLFGGATLAVPSDPMRSIPLFITFYSLSPNQRMGEGLIIHQMSTDCQAVVESKVDKRCDKVIESDAPIGE